MNSDIRIRPARVDDAAEVWPLVVGFSEKFLPERAAFDQLWPELVAQRRSLLVVAEINGSVAGYLLAHINATLLANGSSAWIEEVTVGPTYRRDGVGSALMQHTEDWATSVGAAYVGLASRQAGSFYLAIGYTDAAVFYKKLLPG